MQVTQAKLLAAVTVMLLAGFERSNKEQPCTSSFCSPLICSLTSKDAEQQQSSEVNPHPPFKGVFRDALHAHGLLPAMLGLVHNSGKRTAGSEEAASNSSIAPDRGSVRHDMLPCSTPLFDDGQGTKALTGQVRDNAVLHRWHEGAD